VINGLCPHVLNVITCYLPADSKYQFIISELSLYRIQPSDAQHTNVHKNLRHSFDVAKRNLHDNRRY